MFNLIFLYTQSIILIFYLKPGNSPITTKKHVLVPVLHFRTCSSTEKGSGAAAPEWLETPHSIQQSLIVLLAPHQDGAKQGRRCTQATWSLVNLRQDFRRCRQNAWLSTPIFPGTFWTRDRTNFAGSLDSESDSIFRALRISQLRTVAKCHKSHISRPPPTPREGPEIMWS